MKIALLSVTNKTGIVAFAKGLFENGYQVVSTGGTYELLKSEGIDVATVESITGAREMLDGRVKTLNPVIHAGILHKRNNKNHLDTMRELKINSIDLVCVNLYEFEKAVKGNLDEEDIIEQIDIGGPTMIRAAAKNYEDVMVVTDINDYDVVLERIKSQNVDTTYRRYLAAKAFKLISEYDNMISDYFNPLNSSLQLEYVDKLSYGENPHQDAYLYKKDVKGGLMDLEILNGKPMSYNNYNDVFAAMELLHDFKDENFFAAAIKHSTACCAATGESSLDAYLKSYNNDPVSIYGGIVAFNSRVDKAAAMELTKLFLEIVIAPSYDNEALQILKQKKNLRVIRYNDLSYADNYTYKDLDGVVLKQNRDVLLVKDLEFPTKAKPDNSLIEDMLFGMKIAKNIKSNGIAIVRNKELIAVCGGQTARVFAIQDALLNYKNKDFQGAVLASDAFFPFSDNVEMAHQAGIRAFVQPGGSKNDKDSIEYCDNNGLIMAFTGMRHFKH